MVDLDELVEYTDGLLDIGGYQDYCPNGLQIEGRTGVSRLVSGVTASQELVDQAVAAGADAVLVHHGYFWKSESPRITGMKRRRIAALLGADISLLAYHLPLDGHAEFGNNVQLARELGINKLGDLDSNAGTGVVVYGELAEPVSGEDFALRIRQRLRREPLHVPGQAAHIRRIGWCSGGGQSYIELAVAAGLDAFLSGEVSESTVHSARENGLHFFAAGHHATERYGVAALGEHLAAHFGIEHRFIDIDNPA